MFDILREGHSSPMGGHSGILKTLKRMTTSFYLGGGGGGGGGGVTSFSVNLGFV